MSNGYQGVIYNKTNGVIFRGYCREDRHLQLSDIEPAGDLDIITDLVLENPRRYRLDLEALANGDLVPIELVYENPIGRVRQRARTRLDRSVEVIRQQFLTRGMFQMVDYQEKLREVEAFDADPAPDPENYPMLAAEVGFHGTSTLADVAATVKTKAAQTRAVLGQINAVKFAAVAAIEAAADEASVETILATLVWPTG